MAAQSPLVADFAVVLGVAAATGIVARKLRQPPLLGYLFAGLLVGPSIPLSLFSDAKRIHDLSDLGVVLVMFAVGLEFSLSRAAKVLPIAGLVAAVQIGGMFWAGNMVGVALGLSTAGQVIVGACLAVSSTMVVTKVFDVHPPPRDVRDVVLGVLVLQDIVAIALITIVTAVAQGAEAEPGALLRVLGNLGAAMLAAGLVGLVLIPRLVRLVARIEMPEVDALFAMGLCFALAAMMQTLGYSPALGAFLAGTLVAESGLGQRYEHVVNPVRDVFAAIFFVAIGMTINPAAVIHYLPQTLGLSAAVIVAQATLVTGAGLLSGLGLRRSTHAGLALGQIGEFAFIMMGVGVAGDVVPEYMFTVVVGAGVLTTFTTSVGLSIAPKLVAAAERLLPKRLQVLLSMYGAWVASVQLGGRTSPRRRRIRRTVVVLTLDSVAVSGIVIGAALVRQPLTVWLESMGLTAPTTTVVFAGLSGFAASPFAWGMWRTARTLGGLLAKTAIPKPEAGVADLASTSRTTMTRALQLAALVAAGLFVVGVTLPFVPPGSGIITLLIAVVPSTVMLWRSRRPLDAHVRSATQMLFEVLRQSPSTIPDDPQVQALMHSLGDVISFQLPVNAEAVGKTLADINLRARSGASVLALVDEQGNVGAPTGHERLQAGTILALAGDDGAIRLAKEVLLGATQP